MVRTTSCVFTEEMRTRVSLVLWVLTIFSEVFSLLYLSTIFWLPSSVGTYTPLVNGYNLTFVVWWLHLPVACMSDFIGYRMSEDSMKPQRRARMRM